LLSKIEGFGKVFVAFPLRILTKFYWPTKAHWISQNSTLIALKSNLFKWWWQFLLFYCMMSSV